MKGNIKKITAKGKPKTDIQKKLDYIKSVRKADRELAIENKTFDTWAIGSKVHVDKKKKKSREECRKYKYNPNKEQ